MLSLLSRFAPRRSRSASAPPAPSQAAGAAGSQSRSRRELLRVVLRDTLNRHGIPPAWFDAEVLVSTSRSGERGIHWRLTVKNFDPRLLNCAVSLQNALIKRLTTFDPLASAWLTGLSWQYALPEDAPCPALPHPRSWKEAPAEPAPVQAAAGSAQNDAAPETPQQAVDTRTDLDQLFAARDADFRRHAEDEAAGENATQPMFLRTEPAKL